MHHQPAEGKRPDNNEKSELKMRSINQQHSIWNQIKKDSVKDSNSKPDGVMSQKTVSSTEESPDSQCHVSNSLQKDPPLALDMNLSSREIPKQNHLEQTSVGRVISNRAGKLSSQEQADGSDHIESRPPDEVSKEIYRITTQEELPKGWASGKT